ncbi:MAG: tetratricopeptide repeat protein, partial [Blastocatellia bacterium]
RKDWPALQAMWHSGAPTRSQRLEILQRQFAGGELSFSPPIVSRFKIEGEVVSLRVSTRRTVKFGNTNSITDVRIEIAFVKEGGQWKLWSEVSPLTALLNALTDAKTDEVRRRLLDQEGDLVTRELLFLLAGQSDRAYAQGDYSRSMNLLQSQILVAEWLNNRSELSDAWHKTGIIHFLQKRFDDALTAYRRSLTIDEESGRKEEVARSLSSIALVFMTQSKFDESVEHFQRALTIYESLNRKQEVIRTVENIGNVHNEQGDYATAIEFYQRCVQLYDEAKRANEAAHMVLKIARVEYEQGHDATAIDLFRQAAGRFAAAGNRRNLGYAFHNVANILYEQGDYNAALGFYQRSLQSEREAGTRPGEAGALQGIGLIHSLNGSYSLALAAYEQNLAVVLALGKKEDSAAAWQKVGGANFSLNDYDKALAAYKSALALREQIGDSHETALALLDVGVTLAAKQDYAVALEHYNRSRQLYEQLGNSAGIAAALLNIAQVHYLQRDFARTIEFAQQAADFAKRDNEQDLFWQARHRAGKAYFRLDDPVSARKALTEAINTIETMRPQANRGQQPRFFETKIAPYLAMVDVAIGEGKGNEAYNFSQRAKVRVLTGLLQNVKTQITKTMAPREQQRERQLLGDISNFNQRLYREQERDKPNPARMADLKAKLQKARSDYAAFLARLYVLRPALKTLRGEIKAATVEQAATLVRDTKTALLEFVETDERVYLFVFSKEQSKAGKSK